MKATSAHVQRPAVKQCALFVHIWNYTKNTDFLTFPAALPNLTIPTLNPDMVVNVLYPSDWSMFCVQWTKRGKTFTQYCLSCFTGLFITNGGGTTWPWLNIADQSQAWHHTSPAHSIDRSRCALFTFLVTRVTRVFTLLQLKMDLSIEHANSNRTCKLVVFRTVKVVKFSRPIRIKT